MANLEEILCMPDCWRKQTHVWKRLIHGDMLFQTLRESIHSDSLGKAQQWIDKWESFVNSCDEDTCYKWHTARKLVWCAEQAATRSDFYRTEIDHVCFALKEVPEFIKEDEIWA